MIRIILWNLFLFSMPFILAWLWSLWLERARPEVETQRRWALCAVLGAILVLLSLFYIRLTSGDGPESQYVPPQLENGRVVRGRFE